MPQLNPLVLTDEASTPVNHTFAPRSIESGVATLVESSGVPLGERRVTLSQTRAASGRARAIMKFAFPVTQDVTVNGVTKPALVRTNYVDITFNFDTTSSTQERKDVVGQVMSALKPTQTMMRGYLVDLEGMY